jgi:hypothetical protein
MKTLLGKGHEMLVCQKALGKENTAMRWKGDGSSHLTWLPVIYNSRVLPLGLLSSKMVLLRMKP